MSECAPPCGIVPGIDVWYSGLDIPVRKHQMFLSEAVVSFTVVKRALLEYELTQMRAHNIFR